MPLPTTLITTAYSCPNPISPREPAPEVWTPSASTGSTGRPLSPKKETIPIPELGQYWESKGRKNQIERRQKFVWNEQKLK